MKTNFYSEDLKSYKSTLKKKKTWKKNWGKIQTENLLNEKIVNLTVINAN